MIKITKKIIEVNKDEFRIEVVNLCTDLHAYLKLNYLLKERFNEHFKVKLNDLEFAKLMDSNDFEIENMSNSISVRIDIKNLLKSLK
jgi:hypothetical protein